MLCFIISYALQLTNNDRTFLLLLLLIYCLFELSVETTHVFQEKYLDKLGWIFGFHGSGTPSLLHKKSTVDRLKADLFVSHSGTAIRGFKFVLSS